VHTDGEVVPAVAELRRITAAPTATAALERAAAIYLRFLSLTADVGASPTPRDGSSGRAGRAGSRRYDNDVLRNAAARYILYRDAVAEVPSLRVAPPPRDVAFMWATDLLNRPDADSKKVRKKVRKDDTELPATEAPPPPSPAEFLRFAAELSLLHTQPVPVRVQGSRAELGRPSRWREANLLSKVIYTGFGAGVCAIAGFTVWLYWVLDVNVMTSASFWVSVVVLCAFISPSDVWLGGALATLPLSSFASPGAGGLVVTKATRDTTRQDVHDRYHCPAAAAWRAETLGEPRVVAGRAVAGVGGHVWMARNPPSVGHRLTAVQHAEADRLVQCARSHITFRDRALGQFTRSKQLARAVDGYRRFLGLARMHPDELLVPSLEVPSCTPHIYSIYMPPPCASAVYACTYLARHPAHKLPFRTRSRRVALSRRRL
jgi:hypothetical protein